MSSASLSDPFFAGTARIRNRVLLAPLSGVSDLPFREIAWRYGAGVTVSEMIASRELVKNTPESRTRMRRSNSSPHMVQLAGRDTYWIAEAAKLAQDEGAEIIDINMGCPAKKVTGGYCGSALMREPALAIALVKAVVGAVNVPVTVKMRLGWDNDTTNAPELARQAEDAGAAMITVHGRTRMQFYDGHADWDAIAAVRQVVSLPLVANGDVRSRDGALEIMRRSGADAVMIGRAAQGQPWLPGVIAGVAAMPEPHEVADLFEEQYRGMLSLYGDKLGVRHARKHVGWYLERHAPTVSKTMRPEIMTETHSEQVIRLVRLALSLEAMEAMRGCEAA